MGALNDFHAKNWQRMNEAFPPPHDLKALTICVQEEVGELAGAVLGVTGEKARKAHLTHEDVLDAVADAVTYLSLVAWAAGCGNFERLLGGVFNMVSDRVGTPIKTILGQVDDVAAERARIRAAMEEWISEQGVNREGYPGADKVTWINADDLIGALEMIFPEGG